MIKYLVNNISKEVGKLSVLLENIRKVFMKKVLLIVLCLLYNSCDFVGSWLDEKQVEMEKERKEELEKRTIDYYTSNLTIVPNKTDTKFNILSKEFRDQKHRFEFNICEYKYNNQLFFIGDSPEKMVSIFGEPDEKSLERTRHEYAKGKYIYLTKEELSKQKELEENIDESLNKTKLKFFRYTYKNLGLRMSFESIDNKSYVLSSFNIKLSDYNHETHKYEYSNSLFDMILFRGIPYKFNMTIGEFRKLTNVKNNRDFRSILQKECPVNNDYRIHSTLYSEHYYESAGGGHLTYTGAYNPNISYPIKSISFSERNLEYYKKEGLHY